MGESFLMIVNSPYKALFLLDRVQGLNFRLDLFDITHFLPFKLFKYNLPFLNVKYANIPFKLIT